MAARLCDILRVGVWLTGAFSALGTSSNFEHAFNKDDSAIRQAAIAGSACVSLFVAYFVVRTLDTLLLIGRDGFRRIHERTS